MDPLVSIFENHWLREWTGEASHWQAPISQKILRHDSNLTEIYFDVIQMIITEWSLQNFAHDTAAALSWPVCKKMHLSDDRQLDGRIWICLRIWILIKQALVKGALRWRHNDHAGVSNHQPHGCLLNRLFRRKSKKTSKLRVTGLCAGNSPGTGEFPAQMTSYAENVSIWWRHHESQINMWGGGGCHTFAIFTIQIKSRFAGHANICSRFALGTVFPCTKNWNTQNRMIT